MEIGEIIYYRTHVDAIIIIFDQNKISEELNHQLHVQYTHIFRI